MYFEAEARESGGSGSAVHRWLPAVGIAAVVLTTTPAMAETAEELRTEIQAMRAEQARINELSRALDAKLQALEARFNGLTAGCHSIEQPLPVEILDRGDACCIGLRLQVTPSCQLGQSGLYFFERRSPTGPMRISEDFIWPQVQAELALCRGEYLQNRAIQRGFVRGNVAKQISRGFRQ